MERDWIADLYVGEGPGNIMAVASADLAELKRLALAHLDSARARRVGEAVLDVLAADPKSNPRALRWFIAEAVERALRDEP